MTYARTFSLPYLIGLVCIAIAGCGPVRVATLAVPEGRTTAEMQMDEIECEGYGNDAGYVPLLFGAGIAIKRKIVRGRYADCMEGKGYIVAR